MPAYNAMDVPPLQRVVVLGGLGFIGSHICRGLLHAGYSVRVFDKLYASRDLVRDIESRLEIVEGDIAHESSVLAALAGMDALLHLVHTTVPGSSMSDPEFDVQSNIAASVRWLKRLPETSIRRILYFSSGGTVYGMTDAALIDETHPTNPLSAYGISKLALEKYVGMYAVLYNIDHVILRPSNIYGVGQKLHIGQGIIGVFIDRALRGEPLEIWGAGTNLRDYLYVDDLTDAALRLLVYSGNAHVFNVSSGIGRSVLDIVEVLRQHMPLDVVQRPGRGFDVPRNVLDYARLRVATGWQPQIPFDDGLRRTLAWIRSTR